MNNSFTILFIFALEIISSVHTFYVGIYKEKIFNHLLRTMANQPPFLKPFGTIAEWNCCNQTFQTVL